MVDMAGMVAQEPSIYELNREIREHISILNSAVDIQVKISDAQDQLQYLYSERSVLEDHLQQFKETKEHILEQYHSLLSSPVATKRLLEKTYVELDAARPHVDPSTWVIPAPVTTELPEIPHNSFTENRVARSVASICKHCYRSLTRRHRFFPEHSRRSATVRLHELQVSVNQVWPAMEDLTNEYTNLIQDILSTKQDIATLQKEISSQHELRDIERLYRMYSELALKEFVRLRTIACTANDEGVHRENSTRAKEVASEAPPAKVCYYADRRCMIDRKIDRNILHTLH